MKETALQIKEAIQTANKILLVAHTKPDGDALGALFGMYGVIRQGFGKTEVEMAVDGELPAYTPTLPYAFKLKDSFWPEGFDLVIILDCGGWKRTGFFEDNELNIEWPEKLVVIDHHEVQSLTSGIHYINPESSSTCELICELVNYWGIKIDSQIATNLLLGIAFDTSFFKHSNTSKNTYERASELLAAGASMATVDEANKMHLNPNALQLWGRVLNRMRYDAKSKSIISALTTQDFNETGTSPTDTDGLIAIMNKVNGINFAMLMYERGEGRIKASLRTESDLVDVARIARIWGGGGHKKAAGFEIAGSIDLASGDWMVETVK